MKAFLYGISLQFRLDLRSKSLLITCYLVPLLFFAVMGGIFSSLMPEARETLTQSMTIMGISMGAFIGVPPTILEMYERDMRFSSSGHPQRSSVLRVSFGLRREIPPGYPILLFYYGPVYPRLSLRGLRFGAGRQKSGKAYHVLPACVSAVHSSFRHPVPLRPSSRLSAGLGEAFPRLLGVFPAVRHRSRHTGFSPFGGDIRGGGRTVRSPAETPAHGIKAADLSFAVWADKIRNRLPAAFPPTA